MHLDGTFALIFFPSLLITILACYAIFAWAVQTSASLKTYKWFGMAWRFDWHSFKGYGTVISRAKFCHFHSTRLCHLLEWFLISSSAKKCISAIFFCLLNFFPCFSIMLTNCYPSQVWSMLIEVIFFKRMCHRKLTDSSFYPNLNMFCKRLLTNLLVMDN